ncbi:MAG: hypothetical protein U0638_01370 [Phycisphaerales bacterium]
MDSHNLRSIAPQDDIRASSTRAYQRSNYRRFRLAVSVSTVLLLVIAAVFGYRRVSVYVVGNGTNVTRFSLFGIQLSSTTVNCRAHDELASLGIAQPTPEFGIDVKRGFLDSHRTPSGRSLRLWTTCETLVISAGYAAMERDKRITLWRQIFDRAQKGEEINDLVATIFDPPAADR